MSALNKSGLYPQVKNLLSQVSIDFGGGCSDFKAFVIADLIRRYNLRQTLDIGVYRGRSLLPQALAHKQYTGGVATGVDPWSPSEATQLDCADKAGDLAKWTQNTDFEAMYRELVDRRDRLGLTDHCRLLRMTSAAAAEQFARDGVVFDLIHIDGNHDTAQVVQDVTLYSQLLRPGGFIVLDDVSWDTVAPAQELLEQQMARLFQRVSNVDDFAIFRNSRSKLGAAWDSLSLRRAIRLAS